MTHTRDIHINIYMLLYIHVLYTFTFVTLLYVVSEWWTDNIIRDENVNKRRDALTTFVFEFLK